MVEKGEERSKQMGWKASMGEVDSSAGRRAPTPGNTGKEPP